MKQNGLIIFLDVPLRKLQKMSPKGRPLLKDPSNLVKLYNERYNLYNEHCDVKILKNGLDTEKTMRKIEVVINEYINS